MFTDRPKVGEDDDELLRFQEEFQRGVNLNPSAKVVRAPRSAESASDVESGRSKNEGNRSAGKGSLNDTAGPETPVMGTVTERSNVEAFLSMSVGEKPSTGFPAVKRLTTSELLSSHQDHSPVGGKRPKRSLFAQKMEASKVKAANAQNKVATSGESSPIRGITRSSDEITRENEAKMAAMSAAEIESERQQLLASLDPALIEVLRKRKHKQSSRGFEGPSSQVFPNSPSLIHSAIENQNMEVTLATEVPISKPLTVELPIKPDPRWLNMDRIETEKLAWITMNAGEADTKEEKMAPRFDFHGFVIDPNLSQFSATRNELYHHGEEASRPGYTLEELYTLARSLNQSQRVVALSTIANIIQNAQAGILRRSLSSPLLPVLLQADIVVLLRYAIDDKSHLVISSAVAALRSLLVSQSDLDLLEACKFSANSHIVPELTVVDQEMPATEEEEQDRQEEQYLDILRRDVITGMLEMDLLSRLRYLLTADSLQPNTFNNILDILWRIACTSKEISYKLFRTPYLLDTLFEKYLVMSPQGESTCTRCAPAAMRFLRVLCASGKSLATALVTDRGLMDRVLRYTADDRLSDSLHIATTDADKLRSEAFLTWGSLLSYNLSPGSLPSLHQTLVKRLLHYDGSAASADSTSPEHVAAIIWLFEIGLHAACSTEITKVPSRVRFSEETMDDSAGSLGAAYLNWSHLVGLIGSVWPVVEKQFNSFVSGYASHHDQYEPEVLISCLRFLSSYLTLARSQPISTEIGCDVAQIVIKLCHMLRGVVVSSTFKTLLINVRKHSILLSKDGIYSGESPPHLPSLNSILKSKESQTIALKHQLIFQTLCSCLLSAVKYQPSLTQQIVNEMMADIELKTYIKRLSENTQCNASCYWTQYECLTLTCLAQLVVSAHSPSSGPLPLFYSAVSNSLPSFPTTCRHAAETLFKIIIFNPNYLCPSPDSVDPLLSECQSAVGSACSTYIQTALTHGPNVNQTRHLVERDVLSTQSLFSSHIPSPLLPMDWVYLPLLILYQVSMVAPDAQTPSDRADPAPIVRSCLRFALLDEHRIKSQSNLQSRIHMAAKISRLMTVYLLDSSLFLEPDIKLVLARLLELMTQRSARVDFSQPIPGLVSFLDFYSKFLEQFEAASFCDTTFARHAVLPAARNQSIDLRKMLWCEHFVGLRFIQLRADQMPLPMEKYYLDREEEEVAIILVMARALLQGHVMLSRNPAMYVIALHNVNRFMYTRSEEHSGDRRDLLLAAKHCHREPLNHHLTHYKEFNMNQPSGGGIVCYDALPKTREDSLNSVKSLYRPAW